MFFVRPFSANRVAVLLGLLLVHDSSGLKAHEGTILFDNKMAFFDPLGRLRLQPVQVRHKLSILNQLWCVQAYPFPFHGAHYKTHLVASRTRIPWVDVALSDWNMPLPAATAAAFTAAKTIKASLPQASLPTFNRILGIVRSACRPHRARRRRGVQRHSLVKTFPSQVLRFASALRSVTT